MKIGFIGCGNMGGALATAVSRVPDTEILLSDNNTDKARSLADTIGAELSDNDRVARESDFIFLGVKPNMLSDVLAPLEDALSNNPHAVIISMAAGVKIEKLKAIIGTSAKIIRIMPNTPVAVGLGMITWCDSGNLSEGNITSFLNILSKAGKLDRIAEDNIDAATSVAGCGPAFVYMFIDALARGGEACGLDRDSAIAYACQTLRGAAEMVEVSGKSPEQLRIEVCSPGGSTIEGVRVLDDGGLDRLGIFAVLASFEKNKQLGK